MAGVLNMRNFGQVQQKVSEGLAAKQGAAAVADQAHAAGMTSVSYSTTDKIACIAGALAGAAVVGSYMSGAPIMDVATAFNGAAGAAAGIALGPYIAPKLPKQAMPFAGLGLAIAIPAAIDMNIDAEILAIGVGAYAGKMLAEKVMGKYYSYEMSA